MKGIYKIADVNIGVSSLYKSVHEYCRDYASTDEPDKYVLHRVIRVRKDDYVILGDNCINNEYGIKDKDILGVMTSYVRKGKSHSVTDTSYRLYTWYIMHTIPVRVFFKKLKGKAKRIVKRFVYGKKI